METASFGWAGRILRVDLSSGTVGAETLPLPLAASYLGQAGVNAKILYDAVAPGLDPFSPENPLIFGVGPLGGTMAPCSGRFTVTSKSPLTGIFGDSNCGGHWGPELKFAGFDHIIVTGRADRPVYLWIRDDRVEVRDARHLWGRTTWETEDLIKQELAQPTAQIASIGPAGENRVRIAGIISNLCRAAARTGLGAVMGSKNLKAVAVLGSRGVRVAQPARFGETVAECVEAIRKDPLYDVAVNFGTSAITGLAQLLGFLPTRNFRESTFEGAEDLRGEALLEEHVAKHKGCFNCPVSCSRYYRVTDGPYTGTAGEGPEYESIAALGSKCGNRDLPAILKANTLCNELGLDTISAGNAIAWAMEAYERSLLDCFPGEGPTWGDSAAVIECLRKIAGRRGLGDLLAEGAYRAAERVGGLDFVVHSKKMDYPAVDVRGTKGMALAFSISPRGGDHLKGLPLYEVAPELYRADIREELGIDVSPDYWLRYDTKPDLIRWHEDWHCVVDSLGLCKLEGIAIKPLKPRHFAALFSAATGVELGIEEMRRAGERIWNLERMFGVREGIRRRDDYPPKRLLEEPISTGPSAGERLTREDYGRMLDEYYALRGWEAESGIPTPETLEALGLAFCLER
jgi:aldehyde:ferredoxin oxidoreductase